MNRFCKAFCISALALIFNSSLSFVCAQSFSNLTINGIDASKQSVRYHDSLVFVTIPDDIAIPSSITLSADIPDGFYAQTSLSKANAAKTFNSTLIGGYTNTYFEYTLVASDNSQTKNVKVYVEHPLSGLSAASSSFTLTNVASYAKATLLEAESESCRTGGSSNENSVEVRVLESFTPEAIEGPKLVCGGSVAEYTISGLPEANNLDIVWTVSKGTGFMPTGAGVEELDDVTKFRGPVLKLMSPVTAGRKATITAHVSVAGEDPSEECISADLTPIIVESREGAPLDVTSLLAGCVTEDGRLEITAVSPVSSTASDPVSYNWNFSPKYLNNLVESSSYNTVKLALGTTSAPAIEAMVFVENSCGVGEDPRMLSLDYTARTTEWTGTVDRSWNKRGNWTNGVPGACTDAFINAIGAGADRYPIISESDDAVCNTINFRPGAGVVGLQHLTYERAYVSVAMVRDKWYALSSPLQEMRSADFYYYGYPNIYMKKFNCSSPNSTNYVYRGDWTKSFTSLVEPLDENSGFAVMASSKALNGDISSNKLIVTLPREDGDGDLVQYSYKFNPLNGKILSKSYALNKDKDKSYRFSFEKLQNPSNKNELRISIQKGSEDDTLHIIPNPMMSHMNPKTFYERNKAYMDPNIKMWDGVNNTFYSLNAPSGTIGGTGDVLIAPFQSFVVDVDNELVDAFNITMKLDEDFVADGGGNELRSDDNVGYPYKLTINKTSNGEGSSISITMWPDGTSNEDLLKYSAPDRLFFDGRETTEIYYIEGLHKGDLKAVRSNAIVPIGFDRVEGTNEPGAKLDITGADDFPDSVGVYLVNTVTGEEVNLRNESSFALPDTLYNDGDLQIELRKKKVGFGFGSVSEVENAESQNAINIFAADNTIKVISTKTEPLSQVAVYDETGRLIVSKSLSDVYNASIQLNSGIGTVIVRVVSANEVKSEKVFIK